jgi:hypothetical protein
MLMTITLRNVLGTRNLGDILADTIAQEMQVCYAFLSNISKPSYLLLLNSSLEEATGAWVSRLKE